MSENGIVTAEHGRWTGTNGRYFPPDFDHTKIIPQKQLKGKQGPRQMNMRMIMPFSMYCEGCGECMSAAQIKLHGRFRWL